MSTDAERAAAEKLEADKKAAEDAAAAAAAASAWPIGGYNMFIPLLFISMFVVLVICVDVSTICLVRSFIMKFQYVISTVYAMFMIYSWINLIEQLPIFSTIQKPNMCRAIFGQWFCCCTETSPVYGDIF